MPTNTFGKIRATNHAARDFLVVPEFLMETLIQSSGFFGIGLGGYSQLAGRDYDRFGIGWYYTGLSDEVCPVLSALLDDGQGVEMFYDIAVSKDLRLTLDLQIVDPNAVATDWALVPGIRIRIEFSYLVRQLSKLHAAFPPTSKLGSCLAGHRVKPVRSNLLRTSHKTGARRMTPASSDPHSVFLPFIGPTLIVSHPNYVARLEG